jgi:hypothetical protein
MKIEDNFLDQNMFDELQTLMMGCNIDWRYSSVIDYIEEGDTFQFIHIFYKDGVPCSQSLPKLNPILNKLNVVAISRIKANLLTKTQNIVENEFHVDFEKVRGEKLKQWTTSILYMNTNNGYTKFEDGTKVESVANRMVSFPANLKHTGTSCTDEKTRVIINFNYFAL